MAKSRAQLQAAFAAAQALQHAGRLAEAERAWRALDAEAPRHPGILTNLAMVEWRLGRVEDAEKSCESALAVDPGMVQAQAVSAACAEARGDLELAVERYECALDLKPDLVTVLHGLANLHRRLGALDTARAYAERMTEAAPDAALAFDTLGAIKLAMDDLDGAQSVLETALRLDPHLASAHANLGALAAEQRRWPDALAHAEAALAADDGVAEAHNNRANALISLGRYPEAEAAFERALALEPGSADAQFNRALLWLKQGRWRDAWPGFEARWAVRRMLPWRRDFDVPKWNGEPAPEKTLLIHAEQGIGDMIMVARYLSQARARVGRLVVECAPPLVPLLAAMKGDFDCIAAGEALPAIDLHLPAMSLPGVFVTTPETVPWDGAYVRVPAVGDSLAGDGFKVGLMWAGNPENPNDAERSAPLEAFAPLFDVAGCDFYSLQFGVEGDQIAAAGMSEKITDLRDRIGDFAVTAGVVSELDLVISVCTSMAHLAGAMDHPLWVVLPADADWRWMMLRDDTPWYPNARLFRQSAPGDWAGVCARVAATLSDHVKGDN